MPGVEFERFELVGETTFVREVAPDEVGADWTQAQSLGEFALPAGLRLVRARLVLDGQPTVEREVLLQVEGRTGLQLVLTRDCRGVECEPGTACFASQCVATTCFSGRADACDFVPSCMEDSECGGAAACAALVCEAPGHCFPASLDCPRGEYCNVERGCLAVPDVGDGGVPDASFDSGPPDGGPPPPSSIDWLVEIDLDGVEHAALSDDGDGPCVLLGSGGTATLSGLETGSAGIELSVGGNVVCLGDTAGQPPRRGWEQSIGAFVRQPPRLACAQGICAYAFFSSSVGVTFGTADPDVSNRLGISDVSALGEIGLTHATELRYALMYVESATPTRAYHRAGIATSGGFARTYVDPGSPGRIASAGEGTALASWRIDQVMSINPTSSVSLPNITLDEISGFGLYIAGTEGVFGVYDEGETDAVAVLAQDVARGDGGLHMALIRATTDTILTSPMGSPIETLELGATEIVVLGIDDQARLARVWRGVTPVRTSPPVAAEIFAGAAGPRAALVLPGLMEHELRHLNGAGDQLWFTPNQLTADTIEDLVIHDERVTYVLGLQLNPIVHTGGTEVVAADAERFLLRFDAP